MEKFGINQFEKFKEIMALKSQYGEVENRLLGKAKKYCAFLHFIPGLKMIAVGNSVAMNGTKESSDIDLFIVTTKNRMWYVRVFLTVWLSVAGQRKTAHKHAGKFCLSFFMTDENLSLESIAIEKDIYLYFWILYLKPIVNKDGTYEKFMQANKSWCDFSSYENVLEENKKHIVYSGKSGWNGGWLMDIKDYCYKKIFLPRTLRSYEKIGKPAGVVITDSMLKFHDKDKRVEIRDKVISK